MEGKVEPEMSVTFRQRDISTDGASCQVSLNQVSIFIVYAFVAELSELKFVIQNAFVLFRN